MRKVAVFLCCVGIMMCVSAADALERHAGSAFVPPTGAKADRGPFSEEVLTEYVAALEAVHVFAPFEGQNDALKAKYAGSKGGPLRGGEIVALDMPAEELFGAPLAEGHVWVYLGGITSVDALGVRVQMDLSLLQPDAEVWVIDPNVPRAFGPYTTEDCGEGGCWLATVLGEEAVLMVRTPRLEIPHVRVTAYSHIFLTFQDLAKELSCNVDIACDSDSATVDAGSATALILVGGDWFCSGVLINNGSTEEKEPYFMTANHCVCNGTEARATEVYWDYRATGCNTNDAPDVDTLPRSQGAALLATSSKLDATLFRLDTVPVGDYGRTYLGWDTRTPAVKDEVLTIHYPDATHMRESKGTVRAINQYLGGRNSLIKVHWDEGVTELGSSGAPLLLRGDLSIIGMLSQGPEHTCDFDRSGNLDWFSSFRDFYPLISQYIDTDAPSTQEGTDDCRDPSLDCPTLLAFARHPEMLRDLRALRDKFLLKTALGKQVVSAYYAMAPRMAKAVRESQQARGLFVAVASPFARLGAALEWLEG